jgi:histidinol dehydrogenase
MSKPEYQRLQAFITMSINCHISQISRRPTRFLPFPSTQPDKTEAPVVMPRMKTFSYPTERLAMLSCFEGTTERDDRNLALVQDIIQDVRQHGDTALAAYAEKFDKVNLTPAQLKVDPNHCAQALEALAPELRAALEFAADGIRGFHERQKRTGFKMERRGAVLEQRLRPLTRIGAYVPGGQASYPSTMLMNIIPAQVAGVPEIIVCTPPIKQDPATFVPLAVAEMLGVSDSVFQVGGAQAIAAMAFGTDTIKKVDKVVGPGNQFVALAKRLLYGTIDIDSVAGNSEVLIIVDETANPAFIAADLLAQAEHTGGEVVVLVGIGKFNFDAVQQEIERQVTGAPREKQSRQSLETGGIFIHVETREQAIEVAELKAPEHMEVLTERPEELAEGISSVGAIFIGPYTPEPIGDYVAGPNHVLPTGGTARFFSPLGVDAFLKASNVLTYSKEAFLEAAPHTIALAESEGLAAHAASIRARLVD